MNNQEEHYINKSTQDVLETAKKEMGRPIRRIEAIKAVKKILKRDINKFQEKQIKQTN